MDWWRNPWHRVDHRSHGKELPDNNYLAAASASVTLIAQPNAPTVSTAPHLGDRRDVSQCIADCFESTLAFTTPAYVSLDVPRSLTLLYRSGRAYPQGKITLDVSDPNAPAGSSFRLKLKDPNGAYLTIGQNTQELYFQRSTSGSTRIVAQFVATGIPTSANMYTAEVTSVYPAGLQGTTSTPVRIIIINDQNSALGAGADFVGVQRLFAQSQPGTVLITDGSGSASVFTGGCAPSGTCTFTSPAGDFSTLSVASNVYKRTYPDGTVNTFNSTGQEASIADRFGTTTQISWTWDSPFNMYVPSGFTDPTGQFTWLRYRDATETNYKNGSLASISPPNSDWSGFGVVISSGNIEHWWDTDHAHISLASYDAQHRLTQTTSKAGTVTTYTYRYGATVDSIRSPAVQLADGTTASPRIKLRNAADTLLERASAGMGSTSASPLPAVPDSNLRAKITDPVGNVTFYSLSKFGSPTKTKAPLIPADSNEYDASTGQLLRSISPTGHEIVYTYDGSHRPYTVNDITLGTGDTTLYDTGLYNLPRAIYGSSGATWFTYWTKTGRPLKTSSPVDGAYLTTHYPDSYGRDSIIEDPLLHRTWYTYEATGLRNRSSVKTANNQVTTFTHDAVGRVIGVTNPYGVTQSTAYDVLNRPTWTASSAKPDTTRFYYSTLGQDSATVDAKGQAYLTYRNALGWVTNSVYPGSGTDSVFYDAAGRVVRTRSRALREVTLAYDALNRVIKRTGTGTQSVDSLWYDSTGKWTAVKSRVGANVISADTAWADEQSHMTKAFTSRSTIGGWRVESKFFPTDPGRSYFYLYKKRTDNTDSVAAYTYYSYADAQKRLTSIQSISDTATFYYNGESLVDSVSLRAGMLSEKFTYTLTHDLAARNYTGATSVDAALGRWYKTDSLERVTERGGPDTLFQTFGYDSIGRLRSWQKKAKHSGVQCVNDPNGFGYSCTDASPWILGAAVTPTYDKVGNPNDAGTTVATGNRLTQFNGVTMTYDPDGNMVTRVTATTTDSLWWDEFGRMTAFKRVPQVGTAYAATFAYDGFGRRARKYSPMVGQLEYLWDGDQIIAEVDGGGSRAVVQTYTYYPGVDQPRSVATGGETYFMSTESDGTVNGLIRKSDRTVVAQYTYTPWGQLETESQQVNPAINRLRWKGLPYDPESGFYYMRARYYDPQTRRFISEDPIELDGGVNQYAFGGGDPINTSDPSGLMWSCTVFHGWTYMSDHPDETYGDYWTINCDHGNSPYSDNFLSGDRGSASLLWEGGRQESDEPTNRERPPTWRPLAGYLWFYGNYCGAGGGGPTKNATDVACKRHDDCYKVGGFTIGSNYRGYNAQLQNCNQQLCDAVRARRAEILSTHEWPKGETLPFFARPIRAQLEQRADREINVYFTYLIAPGGSACH